MTKTEFKKIINECIVEILSEDYSYSITPPDHKEVPAKSLKPGYLVKYNNQGPFMVSSIKPELEWVKNIVLVKLQLPTDPSKWSEIRIDKDVPAFEVIKR